MTEEIKKEEEQPQAQGNRDLGRQIIGGVIGALVVGLVLQLGPTIGWEPANRSSMMLVGATVGAILFTLDRFARAGARLTRREEARTLNVIVAVFGMLVLTSLVWGLIVLIMWIWQQF